MEVRIIVDGGDRLPSTAVTFEDREYVLADDPNKTLGGLLESAVAQVRRAYGITEEGTKASAYGPRILKDRPQA